MDEEALTIAQLIEKLQAMPRDMPVKFDVTSAGQAEGLVGCGASIFMGGAMKWCCRHDLWARPTLDQAFLPELSSRSQSLAPRRGRD
jgi:hypothetical protein